MGVNKVAYYHCEHNVFMVQVEMVVFVLNLDAPGEGEKKLSDFEYLYYGELSLQHNAGNQTDDNRAGPDYLWSGSSQGPETELLTLVCLAPDRRTPGGVRQGGGCLLVMSTKGLSHYT